MNGIFRLFFGSLCLLWLQLVVPSPIHHRPGILDSIDQCDDEQRKHISHQLEQTFKTKLPVSDMSLPPSETSIQIFLYVTYYVFNSKVAEFDVKSAELSSEGNIPAWKINKASVKVLGGYKYSHTFSSDSGTYVLTMDNVKMYMIGNKCQIDLGKPDKEFSGSTANWGYKTYIKGTSKDDDNKDLKEKLCHYVKKVFHEVMAKASCPSKTTTTIVPSTSSVPLEPVEITEPSKKEGPEVPGAEVPMSTEEPLPLPNSFEGIPFSSTEDPRLQTDEPVVPSTSTDPTLVDKDDRFEGFEYESFPNDEPLDIPGYLPFVDDDTSKSESSANSASKRPGSIVFVAFAALVSLFFGRALCLDS